MAQVLEKRAGKPDVYCYDTTTDMPEVMATLRSIVLQHGQKVNIYVISGTHGAADGTVQAAFAEIRFKEEDRSTANRISSRISIFDYHLLAPKRWEEMRSKPATTSKFILAFCYSQQWFKNLKPNGNQDKLWP